MATFSSTSTTTTDDRYSFSSSSSPPPSHSPAARLVHRDDVGWPLSRRKKRIIQILCPFLFVFINRSGQHHNNVLFVVVCQPVIIMYATCITLSAIRIMYILIYTCIMYTEWFVWHFSLAPCSHSSYCHVRFLSSSKERCLCTLLQFEGFQINTIIHRDGRDNYMKKSTKIVQTYRLDNAMHIDTYTVYLRVCLLSKTQGTYIFVNNYYLLK